MSEILLVGAGAVHLVTALGLSRAGYRVRVLDAAPDPRSTHDWRLHGATHGGADARMVTATEATCHNLHACSTHADGALVHAVRDGGWAVGDPGALGTPARVWCEAFADLSEVEGQRIADGIHRSNLHGLELWRNLRRELPWLFEPAGWCDGVLRTYEVPSKLRRAESLERELGTLRRVLTAEALAWDYPTYANAVADGAVHGALWVDGFTVQVHALCERLIDELESRGVAITWQRPVRRILRDAAGRVTGVETDDGVERSMHYGVSAGVGMAGLMGEAVHGMAGVWLTISSPDGATHAAKIRVQPGRAIEEVNVIPARDTAGRSVLHLGAGFAYLGDCSAGHRLDLDHPDVQQLFRELEDIAGRYYPDSTRRARTDGSLRSSRRACVRPWTADGRSLFGVHTTADDGWLVATGGHNTGGFTQAPVVAEAVLAQLEGRGLSRVDEPAQVHSPQALNLRTCDSMV